MNLLQMSRSGAVMILAIVVIRALAVNPYPGPVTLMQFESGRIYAVKTVDL